MKNGSSKTPRLIEQCLTLQPNRSKIDSEVGTETPAESSKNTMTTENTAPVSTDSTTATDTTEAAAPKLAALVAANPDVVAAAAALKAAKAAAAAALKPAAAPKPAPKKKSDAINFDAQEVFGTDTVGRFVRVEMRDGLPMASGLYFAAGYVGTRGRNGNGTLTLRDAEMGEFQVDWRTALDDANNGANPALLSAVIVSDLSLIAGFFGATVVIPATVTASVEVASEDAPAVSEDGATMQAAEGLVIALPVEGEVASPDAN